MSHRLRTTRAGLSAGLLVLVLAGCAVDREKYPHVQPQADDAGGLELGGILVVLAVAVVITAVISLLALLPAARHRHRYRPQEGWNAEPVWFAGPPDPARAVEQAQAGDVVRGGAGGSW